MIDRFPGAIRLRDGDRSDVPLETYRCPESLAFGLHRSLKELPLLFLGRADSEVLDTGRMEPDARDAAILHLEQEQEGKIVALLLVNPVVIDEIAGRIENRAPFCASGVPGDFSVLFEADLVGVC
jgi:hypothetical protein